MTVEANTRPAATGADEGPISDPRPKLPSWLWAILFAVGFFASAELTGFLSPRTGGYVSFWLPGGLYVAVLMIRPRRDWPWFMAGALIGNLAFDMHLGTTATMFVLFYIANTAQALCGAWLMRRFVAERPTLESLREFAGLIVFCAVVGPAVGASIGAGSLTLQGISASFGRSWLLWWGSNALSVLLVAPFCLAWTSAGAARPFVRATPRRIAEALLLVASLGGVAWHMFVIDLGVLAPYKFRLIPFLLWAGLRFGVRGSTSINLLLALLSAVLVETFHRNLSPEDIATGSYVLTLQTFLVVSGLVGLAPAIVIGERDRTLADLRRSQQRFENLAAAAFEGIVISEKGRVLEVNDQALKMLGYSREEMLGQLVTTFVAPETRQIVADNIAVGREAVYEHRLLRKDGSSVYAEAQARVIRDENRQIRMTALRDISERKRAEEALAASEAQLQQAQKMEAIGTLAGGIAHDFNNILGAILGNVELARLELGNGHPALHSIDEIGRAGRRARGLVRQILSFSRQHETTREVIRLGDVVKEAASLLRSTLPATVDLVTTIVDDAVRISADPIQVHQILINLGTNAWHALGDAAGRIEITVAEARLASEARFTAGALSAGRYAELRVTDNGAGMDAATVARIFEPFFTTKPVGVGTGLGLSVIHGIVEDHGGAIDVSSRPGQGSTFRVLFPAVAADVVVPIPERTDLPRGAGQRVLYIDDEEPLVRLTERLLGHLGYQVSGFTRPGEALEAVRGDPTKFDLVVTDFNMPVMSGLEVATLLASIRPDLPVILASGFVSDDLRLRAKAIGIRHVLYKPNTVEEMCQAVHQLIGQT